MQVSLETIGITQGSDKNFKALSFPGFREVLKQNSQRF